MNAKHIRASFSAPLFLIMATLCAVVTIFIPGFAGAVSLFYVFVCIYLAAVQFMRRLDLSLVFGVAMAASHGVLRFCCEVFEGSDQFPADRMFTALGSSLRLAGVFAAMLIVILSLPLSRRGDPYKRRRILRRMNFIPFLLMAAGGTVPGITDLKSGIFTCIGSMLAALPWLYLCGWVTDPYDREPHPMPGDYPLPVHAGYIKMGAHVPLLLFTGPVWILIWIYKTTRALNGIPGIKDRKCVGNLLLCLIPFYWRLWVYRSAKRIDLLYRLKGQESDVATQDLMLCSVFGIFGFMVMQRQINKLAKLMPVNHTTA